MRKIVFWWETVFTVSQHFIILLHCLNSNNSHLFVSDTYKLHQCHVQKGISYI